MGRTEKKEDQKNRNKTENRVATYHMTGQLIEKETGQNIESRKHKRMKQQTG
jgi:hypothetical protein